MKFCPNVNSKEYKDLASVQGDSIAHYLWDTYKGEVPQQFYEVKLGGTQTSTTVKAGVKELFEANPELAKIGTLEQYSAYLDTIFPDSKVKDIVYHGSSQFGFDKFSKEKLGEFTGAGSAKLGFFFSNSLENSFSAYTLNVEKDVSFGDTGSIEGVEGTFELAQLDSLIEDLEESKSFTDNEIREKQYYVKSTSKSGSTSIGTPFKTKKEALENYKNDDWTNPEDKFEVIEDTIYGKYNYSKVDWLKDKPTIYYRTEVGKEKEEAVTEQEYTKALSKRKDYLLSEREKLIKNDSKTRVYNIILNSKTLKEFDDNGNKWREETYVDRIKQTLTENKDGLVIRNTYDPLLNDVYVVFEPEQIHILGGKEDIKGFEKFTKKDVAFRLTPTTTKSTGTINEQRAKKWLEDRFPGMSVEFYNAVKEVGNDTVHGYVENSSMYLWRAAEIGTEYHEAYHIVFRTMLSEAQRTELYSEAAAKFGEPTEAEINKLAKQFPISKSEARLLALEEKMAEEFREYVLTEQASGETLTGKTKSWFKNLWNWIKALFSDSLSLKQTYSLIDSNKMSKSFGSRNIFRNSEKFKGYNTAFMQKEGWGDQMFADTVSTLKTHILKAANNFGKKADINKIVGDSATNKGSVANSFIKRLYKVKKELTGDPALDVDTNLDIAQSIELLNLENAFYAATTPEEKQKAKDALQQGLQKYNAVMALGNQLSIRSVYKNIYNDWYTEIDPTTENVLKVGWRDYVITALQDSGYSLKGTSNKNYKLVREDFSTEELSEEDAAAIENELSINDTAVEKIYGKSSLESSPSKALTGKVKELLSTVENPEPNLLGFKTYYNREDIYMQLLQIFNNKHSYSEMEAALKNAIPFKPYLKPVLDFMQGLKAPEKAMLFNAFALTTTEFLIMKKRVTPNKDVVVDIFNPNRKSASEKLVDRWKKNTVTKGDANPKALYNEVDITTADNVTVTRLVVKESKVLEIQKLVKDLESRLLNVRDIRRIPTVKREDGSTSDIAKLLGELAFALNLTVDTSASVESTQQAMQALLNAGFNTITDKGAAITYSDVALAQKIAKDLRFFALKLANFKSTGDLKTNDYSSVGEIVDYNITSDFVTDSKRDIYRFSEYYTPMINIVGESFVASDGTQRFATNVQSHMNEIVTTLKNKGLTQEADRMYEMYLEDPFIGALGNPDYQSILFRFLQEDPNFRDKFTIEDFDAYRESDFFDDIVNYEDLTMLDSLVVRLNGFINGGKVTDTVKIAVSVQADRNKKTFSTLPRLTTKLSGEVLSKEKIIKGQIVQDLLRVAKAKKDIAKAEETKDRTNIIVGYHEEGGLFKDASNKYLGRAFNPAFFQFTAKDDNGVQIVTDEVIGDDKLQDNGTKQLSDLIEKYVTGKLSKEETALVTERLNTMTAKMLTYFSAQADKVEKLVQLQDNRIGFNTKDKAEKRKVIEGFVFTEAIMRNEMVKVFRGNRAMSKDLVDFYKRMGHLSSPGYKYTMKGEVGAPDWRKSLEYGMLPEYNEVTVADLKLNINKAQTDRVNAAAKAVGDSLRKIANRETDPIARANNLKLADSIEQAYQAGSFDSTDAQAFISIEMYRGLMEGEGKWGEEEEKAYKAYKAAPAGQKIFAYQEGFVPTGFNVGDRVPIYPIKTYYERITSIGGTVAPISEKNSYSVTLEEFTKDYPILDDMRNRMEGTGRYKNLAPIHVVNFVSGKKLAKRSIYKITGVPGEFSNAVFTTNDSRGLRKSQTIPEVKENPTITVSKQIKKNMVANVKDNTTYSYNSGLSEETDVSGKDLKEIFHATLEEKIRRDIKAVEAKLKIPQLLAAEKSGVTKDIVQARLDVLKTVRDLVQTDMIGSDMHSNYINALHIVFDESGMPRFNIPLDLPVYGAKYESIIMSLLQKEVFVQKMSGLEAVQVADLGGHAVDNELKFLRIEEDDKGRSKIVHAEIMIREDVARRFGIEPGQSLDSIPEELLRAVGYRTPNGEKSAVLMAKIVRFLPMNYPKAVVVPGQLLKMMGSDFDVDKLNLLFPEVEPTTPTTDYPFSIRKVRPDYSKLIGNKNKAAALTDKTVFTKKALNNIVWDTFEAVGTNAAHFFETFSPLDDVTLKQEVQYVRSQKPELAMTQDWNDVLTESEIMLRNQAGNQLRGIYANGIAHRNVLHHGEIILSNSFAPTIMNPGQAPTVYNKFLTTTADGIFTDKTLATLLGESLDAAKGAVQYELNDNVITAPVRILFANFIPEYNGRTATNLFNQPIVRYFTEVMANEYGNDGRFIQDAFDKSLQWARVQANKASKESPSTALTLIDSKTVRGLDTKYNLSLKGDTVIPMLSTELENIKSEGRNWHEQMIMLANFKAFYTAGKSLSKLGKRVTPDNIASVGKIGNILEFKDSSNAFESGQEEDENAKRNVFLTPNGYENVADQFIGKNSVYGFERGYESILGAALDVASVMFPLKLSPAYLTFKANVKELSGQVALTSQTHQLIDSNLTLMLLMEPESPLYRYFTADNINRTFVDPATNIATRLELFKKLYPKLETNKFIAALEADITGTSYSGIKFDNSFKYTKNDKEAFTTALRTLMFNPQVYIDRPDADKTIGPDGKFLIPEVNTLVMGMKEFAMDIIVNTIVTSGFRPGASSYAELIPQEFWTMPLRHKVINSETLKEETVSTSISNFLYAKRSELLSPAYFDQEKVTMYMQLFGLAKAGGRPLLKRISSKNVTATSKAALLKSDNKFVAIKGDENKLYVGMATNQKVETDKGLMTRFMILPSFFAERTVYSIPARTVEDTLILDVASISLIDDYTDVKPYTDNTINTCI